MAIQDPLTGLIIGRCYRVANELGNGFLEKVYERALAHELRKAKVKVVQQQGIEVFYDGVNVGDDDADLIVEDRVIVEVKAITALDDAHIAQCLNDMKATRLETCLLVNFGKARIQVRRLNSATTMGLARTIGLSIGPAEPGSANFPARPTRPALALERYSGMA